MLLRGVLYKRGRVHTAWRRRTVELRCDGRLIYYRGGSLRGSLQLRGADVEADPPELRGRAFGFVVRREGRTLYASAENALARHAWLEALRACADRDGDRGCGDGDDGESSSRRAARSADDRDSDGSEDSAADGSESSAAER